MKLKAELDGVSYEVAVERDGTFVNARVDDREYQLEARQILDSEYLLTAGQKVYDCRIETGKAMQGYVVHIKGQRFQISLADPKRLSAAQSSGVHQQGSAQIVASMPGKVVRVMVEVGALVNAGDSVLVVEAMKMQNEMKAPKAGVIVKINAATGETVNAGDVLAVIE
jgi:biotin carboxyl carrier protein